MEARTFAGFNSRPSPWGYNWTSENVSSTTYQNSSPAKENGIRDSPVSTTSTSSPEPGMMAQQYANMPAALLTSLKRDKKPFTYTPGGVNLNEVLNARLQKRMERKKKYSEERMADMANELKFDPPKQVIVMPTYNTPLDMYSMENALEALECQAGLVANDKSLSRSATLPRNHKFDEMDFEPNRGVSQSKAFKVLQIITDTDEDDSPRGRHNNFHEDVRFTGIRDSKTIPSKFFQTLQKITGTEEDDEEENIPRNVTRVDPPRPTTYDRPQTRPGFLTQHPPRGQSPTQRQFVPNQQPVSQFQPMNNHHQPIQPQEPSFLRRPAAFLPMKTGSDPLSRVKSVHPTFLANGPRKISNQGGTDF